MKIKSPLKDLTLIQIVLRFDTDEKARKHLETVLWKTALSARIANAMTKLNSGALNPMPSQDPRRTAMVFQLQKPFTVTIGTVFEVQKSRSANGSLLGI